MLDLYIISSFHHSIVISFIIPIKSGFCTYWSSTKSGREYLPYRRFYLFIIFSYIKDIAVLDFLVKKSAEKMSNQ